MAELGSKLRVAMVNTLDCFVPCGSFCVHKVRSVCNAGDRDYSVFFIDTECWSGLGAVALKTGNQLTSSTLVKD